MASYEVEHGIKAEAATGSRRRPDMSTFFSRLSELTTSADDHHNTHAVPTPVDLADLYRLYADSLQQQRADSENPRHENFLEGLIQEILSGADDPPNSVKGVPQSYLDELDRVNKKSLKKTDVCPICAEPFLDDQYPLVVQLPCHPQHRFDMDCIAPWLKLQGTCPLDRKELMKKKEAPKPAENEEEDGEYDDMYA